MVFRRGRTPAIPRSAVPGQHLPVRGRPTLSFPYGGPPPRLPVRPLRTFPYDGPRRGGPRQLARLTTQFDHRPFSSPLLPSCS